MKKIDLGQTINTVANIGVIAGIAFLAVEIRDNSTQARIATTQESVAQRTEWRDSIVSNDVLTDLYFRGLEDYERLSVIEQQRFDMLMQSFMFKMSVSITARNAGLVGIGPSIEERSIESDLLRMLEQPGFRQWWNNADLRGIPRTVRRMTEELAEYRITLQGDTN